LRRSWAGRGFVPLAECRESQPRKSQTKRGECEHPHHEHLPQIELAGERVVYDQAGSLSFQNEKRLSSVWLKEASSRRFVWIAIGTRRTIQRGTKGSPRVATSEQSDG